MNRFVFVLLSALLLGLPGVALPAGDDGAIQSLRETGKAFASVARAVSPSVVFIQVEGRRSGGGQFGPDDFLRRFFGDQLPGPRQGPQDDGYRVSGQGSGFAFQSDGDTIYIMTNNHVVQDADRIQVRLPDGREFDATVTGTDPQSDVAVIEIEADDIEPLAFGSSASLEVGEWVVAIGSPFGLRSSLTVGVVSATGRTTVGISDYEDFIQTDAAINPGNSGGPLVNLDGQVVGMNTAIFSRSGGYMGIGFAIPIDLARNIAGQLIDTGAVNRGFLGVVIQALTQDLAESFDIERSQGILVSQVSEGSPAESAGLQVGDVIVRYQGEPVSDVGDFRNRVALTEPGSEARLTVLREGRRRNVDVTIGALEDAGAVRAAAGGDGGGAARQLGMRVEQPSAQMAERLGMEPGDGVVVTQVEPGSAAAEAGLTPGTVILEVNRSPVPDVAAFRAALERNSERAVLLVRSGNTQRYVVLGRRP